MLPAWPPRTGPIFRDRELLSLGKPRTDNPRIVLANHRVSPKLVAHSRTSTPLVDDR